MPTTANIWLDRANDTEPDSAEVKAFVSRDEFGYLFFQDFSTSVDLFAEEIERAYDALREKYRQETHIFR